MSDFKPAPHIQALLDAEQSTRGECGGRIRFDRMSGNVLSVSCEGYNHQDLYDIEERLLKLGCRYNFDKGIQKFDSMCGRTFTYFNEPK